jgi:hypothetical protein
MNRAERRARAKELVKGRDARRTVARGLKSMAVATPEQVQQADPYPNLDRAGFQVARPRIVTPDDVRQQQRARGRRG